MKLAIIGFGVEGQSAYRYWSKKTDDITICDLDPGIKLPAGTKAQLGENYLSDLARFDLVVRSPGIRPDKLTGARQTTTIIKEFFAKCPAPIIGVTGTKGKGTTSTLITKILEAAGKTVHLGGNIGTPALDFLDKVKADDYVVLELSSFQLMDLDRSPQVAVCLMMAPDHLNWHPNMEEYIEAKSQIFRHQQADDLAVYSAKNDYSRQIGELSPGHHRPYLDEAGTYVKDGWVRLRDTKVIAIDQIGLIGPHNQENVCAAVAAVWDIVGNVRPIQQAVGAFTGLPHRLELAGEVNGVRYYDDSFATTPETAIAAIRSFREPKVLILGGSDKGSEFDELARAVAENEVRQAIVIGDVASKITKALDKVGFRAYVTGPASMREIVAAAVQAAEPDDVVLLSPGCASFGLFRDYKDRGDQFKASVKDLL